VRPSHLRQRRRSCETRRSRPKIAISIEVLESIDGAPFSFTSIPGPSAHDPS
jgi:hypothetical protein